MGKAVLLYPFTVRMLESMFISSSQSSPFQMFFLYILIVSEVSLIISMVFILSSTSCLFF
jgi:hypothetical protein